MDEQNPQPIDPTSTAPLQVTPAELTAAFEAWEQAYRADPAAYLSPEECRALNSATLSEQRCVHLLGLVRALPRPVPVALTTEQAPPVDARWLDPV